MILKQVQDFTEIFSKIMIGEFKGFDKKDYDTAVKVDFGTN